MVVLKTRGFVVVERDLGLNNCCLGGLCGVSTGVGPIKGWLWWRFLKQYCLGAVWYLGLGGAFKTKNV